jgi:TolB protein
MIKSVKAWVVCIGLMMSTGVHATLELHITEGIDSARPIAVVPFEWKGEGGLTTQISDVIASDLQRSGKFSPIPVSQMPQTPHRATEVDYAKWAQLGVDALVLGTVSLLPNGKYNIEYQLVDILKRKNTQHNLEAQNLNQITQEVVLHNRKAVEESQLRLYSHRISDLVYEKLTGEKGAFLTRIAYVVIDDKVEHPYQLRVADYDGYNELQVLKSKEPLMSPSWSPDGRTLAYVSFENGQAEIFIMDIYSGRREKIASYPRHNGSPRFSADGNKLAIVLSKTGSLHIYIYDLKTKRMTRVTHGRSNNTEPFWAPDGNSLIFTSDRGGKPQIYRVDLNSNDARRITWQGNQNMGGQLTPDGKYLVMVHQSSSGGYNIAKQDLQSGVVEVLTKTMLDESPSIAPNGSMVIYSSVHGLNNVLSLVSIDGRFKARLPATNGRVRAPSWSPYL